MRVGTRIDYALSLFGVPLRWRTRITAWEPGQRFEFRGDAMLALLSPAAMHAA
jgi:hypothetical protein